MMVVVDDAAKSLVDDDTLEHAVVEHVAVPAATTLDTEETLLLIGLE